VRKARLRGAEKVKGRRGYGSWVNVAAPGQGTLTWLPAAGATIQRGQQVYRANETPVPLWYGGLPLYRTLRSGVSGADGKEGEENLAALGYTGVTVDHDYTSPTPSPGQRWQHDLGMTESGAAESGAVDPAAVVLAPGPIRVGTVRAALGDPAGGQVLAYTATTRTVTVALDVAKQSLAKVGASATVTLPDNRTVNGTVSS